MRLATLLILLMVGTAEAQYGDSPLEDIARELKGIRDDNFYNNLMNMPVYAPAPIYYGGYSAPTISRGVSTGYGSYTDPIKVKPVKKPRHVHAKRSRIYTYYSNGPLWMW
jgi:hypothetical protein